MSESYVRQESSMLETTSLLKQNFLESGKTKPVHVTALYLIVPLFTKQGPTPDVLHNPADVSRTLLNQHLSCFLFVRCNDSAERISVRVEGNANSQSPISMLVTFPTFALSALLYLLTPWSILSYETPALRCGRNIGLYARSTSATARNATSNVMHAPLDLFSSNFTRWSICLHRRRSHSCTSNPLLPSQRKLCLDRNWNVYCTIWLSSRLIRRSGLRF